MDFADFFRTRSDSNLTEIRGYLFGLMQAKRGAKNLERMEEHVEDFDLHRKIRTTKFTKRHETPMDFGDGSPHLQG